jgi:hypothetical protein
VGGGTAIEHAGQVREHERPAKSFKGRAIEAAHEGIAVRMNSGAPVLKEIAFGTMCRK